MDDFSAFPYALPMLLDGGAVTNLTRAGMPAGVCMEQWAAENPEVLKAVQTRFLQAGSTALLAPTFGANRACLREYGLEEAVEPLNQTLIARTRENAGGALVGALLGPSGLFVPPDGEADFDDVYELYREQVRALERAGADFIFMSSLTCLSDMRAAVLAARTNDLPVLVTMNVDESGRTVTGAELLPVLLTLQAMGADAVGLNFPCAPEKMAGIFEDVFPHAGVPLVARPGNRTIPPAAWAGGMERLFCAGVSVLGGCLDTSPAHIAALKAALQGKTPRPVAQDPDCEAATIETEAFFLGDDVTYSRPLFCTSQLPDDLIALDDSPASAALVEIASVGDAQVLAACAHLTRMPVAVHADSLPVLEAALRYYQGRLLIDTHCALDEDVLLPLAKKYGAILY